MKKKRMNRIVAVLLLTLVSIVSVIGATVVQKRIPSSGKVHIVSLGINVFWDENCTNVVNVISWGDFKPGDKTSKALYLKNSGNAAVILTMTSENWSPVKAGDFISVVWNAEGSTLSAGKVEVVNLTMNVSSGITGVSDFSLDIIIEGTET